MRRIKEKGGRKKEGEKKVNRGEGGVGTESKTFNQKRDGSRPC